MLLLVTQRPHSFPEPSINPQHLRIFREKEVKPLQPINVTGSRAVLPINRARSEGLLLPAQASCMTARLERCHHSLIHSINSSISSSGILHPAKQDLPQTFLPAKFSKVLSTWPRLPGEWSQPEAAGAPGAFGHLQGCPGWDLGGLGRARSWAG